MSAEPEKPLMTPAEISASLAFLNHSLRQFERGLNSTIEMLKLRQMPQLGNQLAYYQHAVGTVRKLISDLLHYKPFEIKVQNGDTSRS